MTQRMAGRKLWAVALAAGLLGTAAFAAPAAHGKAISITKAVNAPIPDRGPGATALFGELNSTIQVPKQGKAKKVRDVNVTIQAVGTAGMDPISDLEFRLYGPGGQHTLLWNNNGAPAGVNTTTLGPLTLDDESRLEVGSGNPVIPGTLYFPWAGSADPEGNPLSIFDNTGARGTWTLRVFDDDNAPLETSTLVSWRLNVVTGRPFLTKVPR